LRANADGQTGLQIGRDHILPLDPGDSANKIELDIGLLLSIFFLKRGMEIFDQSKEETLSGFFKKGLNPALAFILQNNATAGFLPAASSS
jgi:hypothetical protein